MKPEYYLLDGAAWRQIDAAEFERHEDAKIGLRLLERIKLPITRRADWAFERPGEAIAS